MYCFAASQNGKSRGKINWVGYIVRLTQSAWIFRNIWIWCVSRRWDQYAVDDIHRNADNVIDLASPPLSLRGPRSYCAACVFTSLFQRAQAITGEFHSSATAVTVSVYATTIPAGGRWSGVCWYCTNHILAWWSIMILTRLYVYIYIYMDIYAYWRKDLKSWTKMFQIR